MRGMKMNMHIMQIKNLSLYPSSDKLFIAYILRENSVMAAATF
jgi:hypothetical protein